MSINESGEYVRNSKEKPEEKEELDPMLKLTYMFDGFSTTSAHPPFVEKPDNVRYWWNVEHVQGMLDKMKRFADEQKVTQITHSVSDETVVLKDFFDMVERSIEYSKKTNERAKIELPPPDDLTVDQRRKLREQMLGEQKDEDEEEIMRMRKIL
ncbi:MAG: hypothetical protein Q8R40_06180 [bacterium]|nr:hypothetical protein [bacterium]